MGSRSVLTFACPHCERTFQIPESVIPPEGARGRCRGCGAQVLVFADGRADLLSAPAPGAEPPAPQAPPPPPPQAGPSSAEERCWYLRFQQPKEFLGPGPYSLAEMGDMILREEALEEDMGRVAMGTWMPLRAYPALEPFWSERNRSHREYHGDVEHCAIHSEALPGWLCPKCKNYLCADCVENVPVVAGGAARMMCMGCDFEAQALPSAAKKGRGGLSGLFKR